MYDTCWTLCKYNSTYTCVIMWSYNTSMYNWQLWTPTIVFVVVISNKLYSYYQILNILIIFIFYFGTYTCQDKISIRIYVIVEMADVRIYN